MIQILLMLKLLLKEDSEQAGFSAVEIAATKTNIIDCIELTIEDWWAGLI